MPGEREDKILIGLALLNERFDNLDEKVDKLTTIVDGNGDRRNGLVTRVDRMEQSDARKQVWYKAAIGVAVTAIAGFVGLLIKLVYHP